MSDAPPVADPPAAAPEKEPPSEPPAGDKDTPERGAEEKEATDKEAEEKAAKEKDAAEKETKEKEPPVPIPASSLPAVTTDHESPKPVQRTFTTPAGQSVTVIEHAAPPTEHTVLVDKPAPSTETITVIDRPAPTTETITVVKEQAPVTEHITITEHPAPKTEKITIVDNSAPKKEQITISNNAAPKTEQITIVGTPKPPGVVEEKKKEGIAIVDVKPSVIKKPSIVQAVNPPETIVEEQHPSSSSIDTVLVASKPKAASVVVIPTVEKSIQPERARTVHEQVSALPLVPAAQLSALATPVGVFTDYIAPTETVLILQAHAFSLRRQDYSITDEAGNKIFHLTSKFLSTSHRHRLSDTQGKSIWDLRRRYFHWPRQWSVDTHGVRRLHLLPRGRTLHAHFLEAPHHHSAFGELFLAGPLVPGCKLHLGSSEAGPVVACVEAGAQPVAGAAGATRSLGRHAGRLSYRMRVAQGFDMAAACAVCVALDERRSTRVRGWAWLI